MRWLLIAALTAFFSAVTVTQAAWTSGSVANSAGSASAGLISFSHTYPASVPCSQIAFFGSGNCGATLISGQVSGSTPLTAVDSITNNGNVAAAPLTQRVGVTSCEPVAFANTLDVTNPLVDRFGTTFNQPGPFSGAGSTTFDGSTGYATSVVAQTQPPGTVQPIGPVAALGIWFKASSGATGPLFSFAASAANDASRSYRALYLDAKGQVTFVWSSTGQSIGPSNTSGGYANGAWHFAYVTLGGVQGTGTTIVPQVILWVDGNIVALSLLAGLVVDPGFPGYWHLGYAPTSETGLTTAYFGGSLSDFVVFDGATVPASPPTTNPTSTSSFATFAATATEWWPLNDNGTTTFTGTLPVVGTGSASPASAACKSVDLGWSFTNPGGAATSSATSLYAWVGAAGTAIAAPGPGATQNATLTLSHDATYNSYVAGLHLWVQLISTIAVTPTWLAAFRWSPSAATTIIPAT